MNATPSKAKQPGRPTAAGRRLSAGVNVAIYLAVLLIVVILVNILAQARALRYDLTSGRRHSLSPRTEQILAGLEDPVELALILEPEALTGRQTEDFLSILEAYDRVGGENVTLTEIGAGDAGGMAAFARLIERLEAVYADEVARIRGVIEEALTASAAQLPALESGQARISSALTAVEEPSASSQAVQQYLPLVGNYAQALSEAMAQTRQALDPADAAAPIPDYDTARAILAAGMEQPARLAALFADHFEILAGSPTVASSGRSRFRTLAQTYRNVADALSVAREALLRPEPLELSEIVRAMQAESYLLILGGEHATAMPLTSLFPPGPAGEPTFAGEQAISVVMASLTMTEPPVVYFLHAERQSLFGRGSRLIGAAQRLSGQRLRLAEWSVAQSAEPPQSPFPDAPNVYIVLPTSDATSEGMERQAALASTAAELISEGESVLYHVQPSALAVAGQPDVSLPPLAPFGVSAETDLQLLARTFRGETWVPQADIALSSYPDAHLIGRALADLPTRFYQATPLVLDDAPQGVERWPLLEVTSRDGRIWAESDWAAGQWQAAAPGGPRDDVTGPWTIGVAVERQDPAVAIPQRLVILGAAPTWMTDDVTGQSAGQTLANPGNTELLEASIYWLAGLDELVAAGAGAVEVARLSSSAPTQVVGYLVMLVLPAGTLIGGIAVGFIRRASGSRKS
jgi:hypothetical protein